MNPLAPTPPDFWISSSAPTSDLIISNTNIYYPYSFELSFSIGFIIMLILGTTSYKKEYLMDMAKKYKQYLFWLHIGDRVYTTNYEEWVVENTEGAITVRLESGKILSFSFDTWESDVKYTCSSFWGIQEEIPFKIESPFNNDFATDGDYELTQSERTRLMRLRDMWSLNKELMRVNRQKYTVVQNLGKYKVVILSCSLGWDNPNYAIFHESMADNYGELEF